MTVLAGVFDATNTTLIASLVLEDGGVQRAPRGAKGQEQLNRATDCSIEVSLDHPEAAELQPFRVVRVADGDVALPPFTIRSVKRVEVADHDSQVLVASGPTLLDRFSSTLMRGSVPNVSLEPQSNRRVWNYSTPTLSTTSWDDEAFLQDRSATVPPVPVGWFDPYVVWVHPQTSGSTHSTDAWSYYRRPFEIDEASFVVFGVSYDDYGDASCDDVQLISERQEFPSEVYKFTWYKHVFLPAGEHLFAARAYNLFASGAFRAAAFLTDGVTLGDPIFATGVLEGNDFVGEWDILHNPTEPPSCTVGQIIREAVEDAQADGCLAGWTLDFADTIDSNGDAWPKIGEFGIDVDAKISDLLDALSPFADFATAPTGLVLLAYDKAAGRGEASGLTFSAGTNLLSLTRTVEV